MLSYFFLGVGEGVKGGSGDISGLWQVPVSLVFLWHWKTFKWCFNYSVVKAQSPVREYIWGGDVRSRQVHDQVEGGHGWRRHAERDGLRVRTSVFRHWASLLFLSYPQSSCVNALLPSLDNKSSDWHWVSSQISEILWQWYNHHYCAITHFKTISTKWYLNYCGSLNTFTSES